MTKFSLAIPAVAVMLATGAFAHDTGTPHVHPHGAEALILLAVAAIAGFAVLKSGILNTILRRND